MARAKKGTPPGFLKGKVPGSGTATSGAAKKSGLNAGNTPVQMASPRRGGGYPAASGADSSGISARKRPGDPAADAAAQVRGRGRKIGSGAAAGATGHSDRAGFGLKTGSSVDDKRGRTGKESRGVGGESDGQSGAGVGFGKGVGGTVRKGSGGGTGATAQGLSDHIPAHTFASSTIPRMKPKAMASPSDSNSNTSDNVDDEDDTANSYSDVALTAAPPTRTREMATPQSGGMIRASRKGLFTAKAKAAGMSVQAYASHVLGAKKGTFDPDTVRQANFARNFGGGAQK